MRKLLIIPLLLFAFSARSATNLDVSFFFGPSLSQNGNIDKLGDPDFSTAFEFNYFFHPKHGIGLFIGNEFDFEGTSDTPAIRDASIHTFDLHYAFRHRFPNSKLMFTFTPGFGIQTIYDESKDYYWGYAYYDDISTAWIFDYKLMMDYIVSEWDSGGRTSNFFLGVGISQIFSMDDDYAGQDISGNRLSALFRLGVGF
jgi:hypothetical protein